MPQKKRRRRHAAVQNRQSELFAVSSLRGPVTTDISEALSKYFPLTTINTLPDDVLLDIFDHHRSASLGDWVHMQGWYALAHTCQRWRQLVFASSLRLNLQLRCTFCMSVVDMINNSPPFPLILDYGPRFLKTWDAEGEDGFLFALRHLQRASKIELSAPESTLTKLTAAMVEAAPRLEYLSLHSQTTELILPKQFLDGYAPQLRHLILTGASLATLNPLLSSSTSLVSLVLERIPSSAYFSPDNLIVHISSMPQLRTLSISFLSAVPRPGFGSERFLPPGPLARVELPVLKQLIYRGVSAYIEALLARIQTPLIDDIDITLFNQLTLSIPRICNFVHNLETSRSTRARIGFSETSAHVVIVAAVPQQPTDSTDIFLGVSCSQIDFQVSAMAQLCSGLSTSLAPIEELTLGFHHHHQNHQHHRYHWGRWPDEVEPAVWHALLAPFQRTCTLRVHVALAADLARALLQLPDIENGQLGVELLLPELRTIVLLHRGDVNLLSSASTAFGAFVDERNRAGYLVSVESLDLSRL
ncbi:hypothetical protein B0F90DRAFT_1778838 [Multifurca ochricompacta]|uniref:F-box domain-containing protein n=1 Tax=Multifurca ochricompacta TaxID=376703 RepID=A0AAD4LVL4_9AGAM|nr:hypothetical protein B0F90DRAFT_1778838 [Multifurca ochricompacta]